MTAAYPPRTPSEAPWDLSFLRVGAVTAAVATALAAPVTGLLAGWDAALGVLLGAAIVTAFFTLSGVVVAWAGRIGDTLTLPAALLTFLLKALALFAILGSLPTEGWLDRQTLAWTVVVGVLLWTGVQLRWVWTRQLLYVPVPAPPRSTPAEDPDSPVEGG